VLQTIAGGIAKPGTFAAYPALFMFGEQALSNSLNNQNRVTVAQCDVMAAGNKILLHHAHAREIALHYSCHHSSLQYSPRFTTRCSSRKHHSTSVRTTSCAFATGLDACHTATSVEVLR
jgi:hypothetical protein